MPIATRIVANTYRDSVSLMQLAATVGELAGVEQASAVMASAGNLDLLREVGLVTGALAPRPADLLIVVRAKTEAVAAHALERAEALLRESAPAGAVSAGVVATAPRSIAMARAQAPEANLALVSVPGEYAAAEARKAIDAGLHVMLFSDNVSLEDEIALKRRARDRGLLLMGPDCGTAIIDGVPLGFANAVARGAIGCIGASGTGLQQVSSLIDRLGAGVSQVIGTGGRDTAEAVGGITMLAAIEALARDRDTKVIVLVSKPPAPAVARDVLVAAGRARKPVVVNFLGADAATVQGRNLHPARTLEDAARMAVALARGGSASVRPLRPPSVPAPRFAAAQRYVRGLYSGGTFCYEASLLLGDALEGVWSNAPAGAAAHLADPWRSREHTLIDLGEDVFTRGRPHPMIDQRLRNDRFVQEAGDPEVAVLLFDVVLGHGAHPDPARSIVPALEAARARAARGKRKLALVSFLCGTARDPQDLGRQEAALREAGVILGRSNADAVRIAASLVALRSRRTPAARTRRAGPAAASRRPVRERPR